MPARISGHTFRFTAAAAVFLVAFGFVANGFAQSRTALKIAVGGMACLCYLPTVLAKQLGLFEKNGLDVELINFKGGSVALTAVLGGSADLVSGYYDHTVNIKSKNKDMKSIVVYDRVPGLVLVVSPKSMDQIKTIKDLAGKTVGVSAPGSSTDFFLKYLARKNGIDPASLSVVGVGIEDTAVAAQEQGQVAAAVMTDPAVTLLQSRHPDLRILADTRSEAQTQAIFGGDYPGGAIYGMADWVAKHDKESQAIANAMVETLRWIHGHSANEIAAKMPKDIAGADPKLYTTALKNTLPMYSETGLMDPKGAQAVLDMFSAFVPEIAAAKVDLATTYTNAFVEKANQQLGAANH